MLRWTDGPGKRRVGLQTRTAPDRRPKPAFPSWLPREIACDDHGFILTGVQRPDVTDGLGLATTMPGVFAAGDVRSNPVKRVAAAVGDGSTAIRQVFEYRSQRQRASTLV